MENKTITILNLYSNDMNIYGDYGNVLTLEKRLKWYGYNPVVIEYNHGDKFPDNVDIIVGGGGQDSGQNKIQKDLLQIGPKLKELAEGGTPMLVICGLYQLFGHYFKTSKNEIIKGIELLDIKTVAGSERLIGNIIVKSEQFGNVYGYENHSGQTFLGHKVAALGRVKLGAGNNMKDVAEGARYKNVIGSYMHGSLLPKNPKIADFLIEKAVEKRYGRFTDVKFKDDFVSQARKHAAKRPR